MWSFLYLTPTSKHIYQFFNYIKDFCMVLCPFIAIHTLFMYIIIILCVILCVHYYVLLLLPYSIEKALADCQSALLTVIYETLLLHNQEGFTNFVSVKLSRLFLTSKTLSSHEHLELCPINNRDCIFQMINQVDKFFWCSPI